MDDSQYKVITSAPAKVILFGEHSVVYGTPAIATSVDRRTIVEVTSNSNKTLQFHFEKLQINCSFPLPLQNESIDLTFSQQQTQAIECGLLVYKSLKGADDKRGVTVTVSSDFTLSAGLGSSASFSIALVSALLVDNSLQLGDNPFNEDGSIVETILVRIKETSHECEKIFHGNPSGIDTATCTLGGIVRFQKGKGVEKIADSFPMKVAVVNSRVERQTSKIVEKVRGLRERLDRPVNSILENIGQVVAAAEKEITDPTSEATFLDLVRMNHGLLSALGVSHPVLERIGLSVSELPVGFKLTGAGCGGNALIFIPSQVSPKLVEEALEKNGFQGDIVSVGVPGLQVKVINNS